MSDTEALKEFKQGLIRLRNHYPGQALAHMRRAVELDSRNPFYLSYFGLLLGLVEKKWAEAQELCNTALRMKRNEAQLYLNLAEVYLRAGKREDTVDTLTMGLRYTKRDLRLGRALRKLGVRRQPVFTFLDRKHFLNRSLGKLRQRVLKVLGDE